jgi:hypothetical protein
MGNRCTVLVRASAHSLVAQPDPAGVSAHGTAQGCTHQARSQRGHGAQCTGGGAVGAGSLVA